METSGCNTRHLTQCPDFRPFSRQLLLTTVFKHLNNSIRRDPRKTYSIQLIGRASPDPR